MQRIHWAWRRWENAGQAYKFVYASVCVRATVCVCLSAYRLKYLDMSKIYLSRSKGQTNNYRMRRNFLWAAAVSISAAAAAAVAAFQNDAIKLMIAWPRKR